MKGEAARPKTGTHRPSCEREGRSGERFSGTGGTGSHGSARSLPDQSLSQSTRPGEWGGKIEERAQAMIKHLK